MDTTREGEITLHTDYAFPSAKNRHFHHSHPSANRTTLVLTHRTIRTASTVWMHRRYAMADNLFMLQTHQPNQRGNFNICHLYQRSSFSCHSYIGANKFATATIPRVYLFCILEMWQATSACQRGYGKRPRCPFQGKYPAAHWQVGPTCQLLLPPLAHCLKHEITCEAWVVTPCFMFDVHENDQSALLTGCLKPTSSFSESCFICTDAFPQSRNQESDEG